MLSLTNLSCRMAGRPLIDDGNLTIMDGWRVGIVGANGAGKSTLFRLITRELQADGGEIGITARHRIGYVKQEIAETDDALIDLVLAADTERSALLKESETSTDPYRIGEVHNRLVEIDAHAAPARAAAILSGLGFSDSQITGPYSALSGGWRMRVSLAAVLFTRPELLLLDEPTNHLDLEAIIWLENYLSTYPHTLLIISHDRELLNTCADHIVHLYDRKLTLYGGNYDAFERERALKLDLQQKTHEKQQAQRAHIQKFIDRFRYKASKARQAQSRIKMLEKMDVVDAVLADRGLKFNFPQPEELASPLVAIDKSNVGYPGHKPVLFQVDEVINTDDRIALLGANGNGKSTLIKLIAGKLKPLTGEVRSSNKLKIGYFSQHQADELNMTSTPFIEMTRLCTKHQQDSREPLVRARLGQFGFSKELQDNRIATLSGGEKARLLFAFMSFDAPHVLLLDEPTNHLDIDARSALVDALNSYEGAVVIVSHDPSMLERVADRLWLVHDGAVKDFDGDLADYRAFVMEQRRASRREDKPKRVDEKEVARKSSAEVRRSLAPLMKKMSDTEKLIEKLNVEKLRLETLMADHSFYQDPARVQKTQMLYAELVRQLAVHEQVWLDTSEAYEEAKEE